MFTHKNGDYGAIYVTVRSYAALICKKESHISNGVHTLPEILSRRKEKLSSIVQTELKITTTKANQKYLHNYID